MTTATPSAQAMPAGTILQASNHLFYEVVRATAKTIWVNVIQEKIGRTPSGSRAAIPIRGAYVHDKPMRFRYNPATDRFVKIGIYRAYVYKGFVWDKLTGLETERKTQ